jgi:hypothetical protein
MPLIPLNLSKVQLKAYVVESLTESNPRKKISYRFENPSLAVREKAINKAIQERNWMHNEPNGSELIKKLKLYLECSVTQVNQPDSFRPIRIYLLTPENNQNEQLQALDVETLFYGVAQQFHQQREIESNGTNWVVIDQLMNLFRNFYELR